MASSIASLVPEPIEKWAVWAASPSSTTFPWSSGRRQLALRSIGKLFHRDRFRKSGWPSRSRRTRASQKVALSALADSVQPGGAPGGRVALNNEGRVAGVVAVGVTPEQTMLRGAKRKREFLERLRRPEPDVLVVPQIDLRREVAGEVRADATVGAVGGHDEVILPGKDRHVAGLDLLQKAERHPKCAAATLEDIQQAVAGDARKAVPARDAPCRESGSRSRPSD